MGEVLKKAGYNIEYVQADYLAQFAGLKTGDLTLAMEIWATTGQEALNEAVASGKVENLGETGMVAKEEWWYPDYMKEKCPGLPNWEALKEPACAEAFSIAETAPKGRYLCGPVTWGGFDEERVEALDLPFEVVHAGTDAALFAELESAYQRQAPIMLWIYSPHWAPAKYKGEWVEFPPYEPACYTDPSWGINPDAAYDCGKPTGPIWKAGWVGIKDKWPGAYKRDQGLQHLQRRDEQDGRRGRPRRPGSRCRGRRLGRQERGPLEEVAEVGIACAGPTLASTGQWSRRSRCLIVTSSRAFLRGRRRSGDSASSRACRRLRSPCLRMAVDDRRPEARLPLGLAALRRARRRRLPARAARRTRRCSPRPR